MYTVVRNYYLHPGTIEEFIQQVQRGLVPIINQLPGFISYDLAKIGENEVVVITTFESLADAKAAAQKTMTWINEHTDLYFQGFSKPMAGLVRVHCNGAHPASTNREELLQGVF